MTMLLNLSVKISLEIVFSFVYLQYEFIPWKQIFMIVVLWEISFTIGRYFQSTIVRMSVIFLN